MSETRVVLKVFIDQCVPDSVGAAFRSAGHDVVLLREELATNSPDPLVAAVAERNGAILVSLDNDFRAISQRRGVGRRHYRSLSLIKLSCRESRAADRVRLAMSLIEHEWIVTRGSGDQRLFIDIGDSVIRTNR